MIAALASTVLLSLPVRVDGEGYLRFVREGRIVYASSATLAVNQGALCAKDLPVTPTIRIPANAVRLEVDLSGNVYAVAGAKKTACGRFVLAKLETTPTSDRGFLVSACRAVIGNPGEGTFGVIRSSLEGSAAPSGSTKVAVRAVSEVEGDQVVLGDIADINADEASSQALKVLPIGPAPAIGVDTPILASRIQGLLKRAGFEAEIEVPQGAVVRRKAQLIKSDDFVSVAIRAAQQKLGAELPLTASESTQGDFRAPLGQVELKAESTTSSGTTMSVTVGVYVEGRRVNSRTVSLKVDASAQVKAGATVKIVMKSAGVTVEVGGRARTGGMVGQKVTVLTDTGSVLTGVVIGADRIEVKL